MYGRVSATFAFCACSFLLFINDYNSIVKAEDKNSYLSKRRSLLQEEWKITTGGGVVLNADELKVNSILMKWKAAEMSEAAKPKGFFPPAHNFMTVKAKIEESDVFRFIKKMPKGAALHIHDQAMASPHWMIRNITYRPDCYMCINKTGYLLFRITKSQPVSSQCKWETVNQYRCRSGNASLFDAYLYGNLSVFTDNPAKTYRSQYDIWHQFVSVFQTMEGLMFNTETFGAYFEQALTELYADNVQYVETRALLGPVVDPSGVVQTKDWAVSTYNEVQRKFSKQHPDFFGAKTIYGPHRSEDLVSVMSDVKEAIRLHETFPDSIAGFDLDGNEDQGHALKYFLDALLYPSQNGIKLPYFFHAGETDWEGMSADADILDALLLNASRIGHGYAIMKHPRIRKLLRERDIAIEVNPISNQVLMLVDDLRNHPAAPLMAEGFPIIISSDDPAVWGSTGMSYDFYEAFMGLGGAWANLATLKKLTSDSIRYSATGETEKAALYKLWQKKWDVFIKDMLRQYWP